ncbi:MULTISPECIES: lipid II flippase MurJ [Sphingobacterium]|uniref:lipid II flippase MurJ n=1 Tax=Sphingobacterium TaxID=28453 RepID=UPI002579791D|nr:MULTISPECIES: lipid II flippase MurJ [Sphingobacterium]
MKLKVILFGLKLFRLLFTVATLSVVAKYYGSSFERDNWLLAYSTFLFIDLAIWGPLNEVFRAKYVEVKTLSGQETARNSLASLFKFIAVGTVVISILFFFGSQEIAKLLLPNGSTDKVTQLTFMLEIIGPSLLLNQFTLLFASVLNAHDIFFIPEISGVLTAIFNVLFIVLFYNSLGIYALFVGHYFSLLILLLLLLLSFYRHGIPILKRNESFSFAEVRPYLLYSLPFFFPYFVGQLSAILEKYLAMQVGAGTISNLDYSRKFVDIPVNVLSSVVTTLFVPTISSLFFGEKKLEVSGEISKFLSFGQLVLTFLISFVIFYSEELIFFLLDRGSLSIVNLIEINNVLLIYIIGSLGVFLYVLFGMTMLSTNDSKRYAIIGFFTQALIIIINYLGYKSVGIYIFPYSYVLIHTFSAIVMILLLGRRLVIQDCWPIVKYIISLLLTIILFYTVKKFFIFIPSDKFANIFNKSLCYILILIPLLFITNIKAIKLFYKNRSLS